MDGLLGLTAAVDAALSPTDFSDEVISAPPTIFPNPVSHGTGSFSLLNVSQAHLSEPPLLGTLSV